MRRRSAPALILALWLAAGAAGAQPATAPHTGDAWIDARLADIGRYAATYRDAFVDELARYQRAPRELVAGLLARPGWTPGDVYFACALAVQLGRPCREVADERDRTPGEDWAAVANRLGLAPDAAAWDALRGGLTATYARWGRPLPRENAAPPLQTGAARPAPAGNRRTPRGSD